MSCPNRRSARLALSAFACALTLMAAGLPARADTAREQQTRACKGDALRLCALAIPNEQKITACMERKKDKLSPACRAYFKDTPAPRAKAKTSQSKR
jgi:hypothetical protein